MSESDIFPHSEDDPKNSKTQSNYVYDDHDNYPPPLLPRNQFPSNQEDDYPIASNFSTMNFDTSTSINSTHPSPTVSFQSDKSPEHSSNRHHKTKSPSSHHSSRHKTGRVRSNSTIFGPSELGMEQLHQTGYETTNDFSYTSLSLASSIQSSPTNNNNQLSQTHQFLLTNAPSNQRSYNDPQYPSSLPNTSPFISSPMQIHDRFTSQAYSAMDFPSSNTPQLPSSAPFSISSDTLDSEPKSSPPLHVTADTASHSLSPPTSPTSLVQTFPTGTSSSTFTGSLSSSTSASDTANTEELNPSQPSQPGPVPLLHTTTSSSTSA